MLCKVLKLNSGETVIGNITEESRGYVEVHRPLKVVIHATPSGSMAVALMKWDPIADFNLPSRIFKQSIVSVSEPSEEFRDNYLEVYNKYDSKDFEEEEDHKEEDDTSENLSKIEEMLKDMMQSSNTKHTLH
jgi:MinD-like ATPase involved in chromosome partitioning or flagellar assembly